MPKVQLVPPERARIDADASNAGVEAKTYFAGAAPLHLKLLQVAPGAVVTIAADGVDMLSYVWLGSVAVGEVTLLERSSLIVETGGRVEVEAGEAGATLLQFAARDGENSEHTGDLVHLLPADRVPRAVNLAGDLTVGGALHADATGFATPLWLHENEFRAPNFDVAVHSHSEDEIIFVQSGEIVLGSRSYGPGTALAIAANTNYGFQAGSEGLSFINFRASAPTYVLGDGTFRMDEGEFWREAAGVPAYL